MKPMKSSDFRRTASGVLLVLFVAAAGQGCAKRSATLAEVTAKVNASAPVQELMARPGHTLEHKESVRSGELRTEKFQHYVNGVEVIGSGVSYHESPTKLEEVRDYFASFNVINVSPRLFADEAAALALEWEGDDGDFKVRRKPVLKILPLRSRKTARLIYAVELESSSLQIGQRTEKEVWIGANSGEHIATLTDESNLDANVASSRVLSARGVGIIAELEYEESKLQSCKVQTIGSAVTTQLDARDCKEQSSKACQTLDPSGAPLSLHPEYCPESRSGGDPSALRADENARKFLDYFKQVHQRDSYDGNGAPIVSVVHVGLSYANATWYKRGKFLAYGDGDGNRLSDFTMGVDVAGHELTHAVIQSSARLVPMGESGALNESLADFFGKMIEGTGNWSIGKSLVMDSGGSLGAVRDLQKPSRLKGSFVDSAGEPQERPYPSSRTQAAPAVEPCTPENDSCAVHFNATIPGHAWYLITHEIGKEKAEHLLYVAMTQFMNEISDFESAAGDVLSACSKLYAGEDCAKVRSSLLATGMLRESNQGS